jgi:hypothetical protein
MHGVSNNLGSNISTKINYITVATQANTTITCVHVEDMATSYSIAGASLNLQNHESANWSNTTTGADGKGYIATLSNQTIDAFVTAAGYQDQDHHGFPALDFTTNGCWGIDLINNGTFSVLPGNVTLYVKVTDYATHLPLSGSTVGISYGTLYKAMSTNSAGMATFTVPNKTNVVASAGYPGYAGGNKLVNTGLAANGGSASVSIEIQLFKNYQTTVPTTGLTLTIQPTVCTGGICVNVTASPTGTILPGCEDPNSAACTQAHADFDMGLVSQYAEMLIGLSVFATVMYLLGIKLG